MQPKMPFLRLAVLVMTLGQIGCAPVSRVQQGLLYPPSGILRLAAGQTYQAQEDEVWHSGARYQQLELSYIDAVAALKQTQK
jgi:hypothetical protein